MRIQRLQLRRHCGAAGRHQGQPALSLPDQGRARASAHRALPGQFRRVGAIDHRGGSAPRKLHRYVALYHQVMRLDRMCLCGMFAAEYAGLAAGDAGGTAAVLRCQRTLAGQGAPGRAPGPGDHLRDSPRERARVLLGTLEGAMLIARTYSDEGRDIRSVAKHLLADLAA